MTNQEIDRRLALAIGWFGDQIHLDIDNDVFLERDGLGGKYWRHFSHTDPAVIWPIAERFNAFPKCSYNGSCEFIGWHCWAMCRGYGKNDNPATASALAVIAYVKGRK